MNVGLRGLRGTLEAALDSDDGLASLIKLICTSAPRHSPPDTDPTSPPTPSSTELHIAESTLDAVVQMLQGIRDRRELEIKRTCQANAADIGTAMRELSTIQTTSTELKRRAQDITNSLKRMGTHFSTRQDALQQASSVAERIDATRASLALAIRAIALCQEAASSIGQGELYHARRVLFDLRESYSEVLGADGDMLGGRLSFQILNRIEELETSIDAKLISGLNAWLTRARAVAVEIGERSIRGVDRERGRARRMEEQRQRIIKQLQCGSTTTTTIEQVAVEEESEEGSGDDVDSNLDMALFLRCVHLHASTNTLSILSETYVDARQAQLGADLAPPSDLLDTTQHCLFLYRIVGYFVIESRVAALAPELGSVFHAEAAWEGASAALAAELSAAIDESNRPEAIRELKVQALLACDAIDRGCGETLSTRGIRAALAGRVERYRVTMTARAVKELEREEAGVEDMVNSLAKDCELYLAGLVEPHEMAMATFVECDRVVAAAMAQKVAAFIGDDYGDGNEDGYDDEEDEDGDWSSDEEDEEEDEEDDVESLSAAAAATPTSTTTNANGESGDVANELEEEELVHLVKVVALASKTRVALESLRSSLGLSSTSGTSTSSTTQLDGVCATAEDAIAGRIAYDTEPSVDAFADLNLLPNTMSRSGAGITSAQCKEIIKIIVSGKERLIHASVLEATVHSVVGATVQRVFDDIFRLIASDDVPFINAYGVQGIVRDLEAIVTTCCLGGGGDSGRSSTGNEDSIHDRIPALEFFRAIAFNTVADVLDLKQRDEKYKGLNFERAVRILEKIKDIPAGAGVRPGYLKRAAAIRTAAALRAELAVDQQALPAGPAATKR